MVAEVSPDFSSPSVGFGSTFGLVVRDFAVLGFPAFDFAVSGVPLSDASVFVNSGAAFVVSGGFVRVVRGVRLRAVPRVVVRAGLGFGSGFASVSFGASVSGGFSSVLASSARGSGGRGIVAPTDERRRPFPLVVLSEVDSVFSATAMPPLKG